MSEPRKNVFCFGEFELDADRRLLLRDGETVPLKAKAFDLLLALVENRGEILSKNQLLDMVWENQFVEENNLTVHVAALRKVLGEKKNEHRYIVTVPGKGYRFVGDLSQPSNMDVIVESRSVARIVVEEEISETDDQAPNYVRRLSAVADRYALAGIISGVLLLTVAGAGWFYGSRAAVDEKTSANTAPRFSARVLTTAVGGVPERVAISPDGKTIAFVERRRGRQALRLGEIETNNSVEIIPFQERIYRHLAFTPDGKNLYFTARDANHFDPALMRVSILGGAAKDLAPKVSSTFTFSPDGKFVAFLRNDPVAMRSALVISDSETGLNERELWVPELPSDVIGAGVAWSPDGRSIVFASSVEGGSRLNAVDVADNSVRPIGATIPNRIVNITWMPDGSGLVINRNTEPQPNDGHIWFVPYPAGESVLLTDEILTYSFASLSTSSDKKIAIIQTRSDPRIAVSKESSMLGSELVLAGSRSRGEGMNGITTAPDGKILFTAVVNDSRTIWEMNPDGSEQRQLTSHQKRSLDAQISVTPDNRFIIFESERTGSLEVWRANRDGSDAKPLTNGGHNSQPAVAPDGSWLVYTSLREGQFRLRRIAIDGGEPAAIAGAVGVWPDISPDGKLVAYVHGGSARDPSRELRVIPIDGGSAVFSFKVPLSGVLYNRLRWWPDGSAIFYKDNSQGLWRQDLSGAMPIEIPSEDDLRIFHFAFSGDGSIVYSGGTQMREIVILESN